MTKVTIEFTDAEWQGFKDAMRKDAMRGEVLAYEEFESTDELNKAVVKELFYQQLESGQEVDLRESAAITIKVEEGPYEEEDEE